jgi:hypothetical protein
MTRIANSLPGDALLLGDAQTPSGGKISSPLQQAPLGSLKSGALNGDKELGQVLQLFIEL